VGKVFSRKILYVLLIIFFLAVVVRGVSFQFDGFFDPDSHFHARLSQQIADTKSLIEWDALSLQGRVYSYPPLLHVLIGSLAVVSGLSASIVLKIMGVLVGGLLVVSVYLLAAEVSKSKAIGLWSGLFAGVSSIAVWRTAGYLRPDSFALTLIPLLLYLWITKRELLAGVLSLAMVLLHPLSAVVYAVLLGSGWFWNWFRKKETSLIIPATLVGMFVLFWLWIFSIGLPFETYVSNISLEATELTSFLAMGYILFFPLTWAFAVAGVWKVKLPENLWIWCLITFAASLFGPRLASYFVPFYAILGAYGIFWVIGKLEVSNLAKKIFTIMVIMLGIATLWVAMEGIDPYVSGEEETALLFLKEYSVPGESVLTVWDQGHVVGYYTGLPLVIDGYFEFAHELDERNRAWKEAYQTNSCEKFLESMDSFGAKYFYLPPEEFNSRVAKNGILKLETCENVGIIFSSSNVRIFERKNTFIKPLSLVIG
jgi:asparagine N-glycosylation enzyme membrane subunit Stt3